MTTLQLADNLYPSLHMDDSIGHALQLMNEFKTTHLPVVADDKFLGVIGEDDLMNENLRQLIEAESKAAELFDRLIWLQDRFLIHPHNSSLINFGKSSLLMERKKVSAQKTSNYDPERIYIL